MSLVLKGMEMPRDCPSCPLSYWANHTAFLGCRAVPGKKYAMREEQYRKSDTPPDWCPLLLLPEKHGPLIDCQALLEEARRLSGPFVSDGWSNQGVFALIARQPAIVESEGDD